MKRLREERTAPPAAVLGAEHTAAAAAGDVSATFSPDFAQHLSGLDIDPTLLNLTARQLPRYIRLNPRSSSAPSLDALSTSLHAQLHPTVVPDVYRLTASTPVALAASAPYKQGAVYGIDLASVLAVRALSLPKSPPSAPAGDTQCLHVLDLCCAPGAKLSYIHDLLAKQWRRPFTLTGVDVSLPRLSLCRNLLHKYDCRDVTLALADGRSFQQPPPAGTAHTANPSPVASRPLLSSYVIHDLTRATHGAEPTLLLTKRQKKALRRKRANSSQPLPSLPPLSASTPFPFATAGYHHILVDAQCSHDGSVRHLVKQSNHSAPHLSHTRTEPSSHSELPELQRALLSQAWSLLRVGGVLVYSTCSTQREQNEDVVEWLIEQHGGEGGAVQPRPVFTGDEAQEVSEEEEEQRLIDELRKKAAAAAQSGDTGVELSVVSASTGPLRWKRGLKWARSSLPQECVRLTPLLSGTSGLFVAKLRKLR